MIRIEPLLLLVALSGCALGRDCGPAAIGVKRLQCDAAAGDKRAQLELGVRYETGDGVPRDLNKAERLYIRAARTEVRSRFAYSAPIGKERRGRILASNSPTPARGLPAARDRLLALRSRRALPSLASRGGQEPQEGQPPGQRPPLTKGNDTAPGIARAPVTRSNLSPAEIVDRLLDRLARPEWKLSDGEVNSTFGFSPGAAVPRDKWVVIQGSERVPGDLTYLQFMYRLHPCAGQFTAPPVSDLCTTGSSVAELLIVLDYSAAQALADQRGLPPSKRVCVSNSDLARRLQTSGWRLIAEKPGIADARMPAPQPPPSELVGPKRRIFIEPFIAGGSRCLSVVTLFHG